MNEKRLPFITVAALSFSYKIFSLNKIKYI